jgi:hypothetical protein
LASVALAAAVAPAGAQVRGVYPSGMSATNAGVTAASGFTYSNLFIFNDRHESTGPDGEVVATGTNAVMLDLSTIVWVSRSRVLGARVSAAATLIFANNSLASDAAGFLSAGGGVGDSYYQPIILGWDADRVAVKAGYGVLAPTGRFDASASDNVGSGYWTHAPNAGITAYLTAAKTTAVSAYYLHEVHTEQEGTAIRPGQTANLDYSLARTFGVREAQLQVGLVGYGQWQTTARTGPSITPDEQAARYRVNAVGAALTLTLPARKLSVGTKYFREFATRSTFEGHTLHISGAVTF